MSVADRSWNCPPSRSRAASDTTVTREQADDRSTARYMLPRNVYR